MSGLCERKSARSRLGTVNCTVACWVAFGLQTCWKFMAKIEWGSLQTSSGLATCMVHFETLEAAQPLSGKTHSQNIGPWQPSFLHGQPRWQETSPECKVLDVGSGDGGVPASWCLCICWLIIIIIIIIIIITITITITIMSIMSIRNATRMLYLSELASSYIQYYTNNDTLHIWNLRNLVVDGLESWCDLWIRCLVCTSLARTRSDSVRRRAWSHRVWGVWY